jgi:hypothetical protein
MVKNIVINKSNEKQDFTNFPFLLFTFFDKIQEKRNDTINNDNYNSSLKNLVEQFQQKCPSIDSLKPTNIFSNILFLFQKEFGPLTGWGNVTYSGQYSEPKDYPKHKFPKVIDGINNFQKNYKDFLTDLFGFILIFSKRCPTCKTVYDAHSVIKSFLSLNCQDNSNIMSLIENYLVAKQTNISLQCNCGYQGCLIEKAEFYNTPRYLILGFGENLPIAFDTQISLSDSNKIAKQYKLYAAINKCNDNNSNAKYVCSISEKEEGKEKEIWKYYEGDSIEKCGNECLKMGIPSCAIYKRL